MESDSFNSDGSTGHSIASLKSIIYQQHGCDSEHNHSVRADVGFRDQVIWQGIVEVFDLIKHPFAKRCFVWKSGPAANNPYGSVIASLESGPISCPEIAIRAAIVADIKTQPGQPGRIYSVCFLALDKGVNSVFTGDLEFVEDKAFLISEYWPGRTRELKSRIEIDPSFLQPTPNSKVAFDYFYQARVPLPQARDN
jgi:hypothetical protein